jgi:hypothetical protein
MHLSLSPIRELPRDVETQLANQIESEMAAEWIELEANCSFRSGTSQIIKCSSDNCFLWKILRDVRTLPVLGTVCTDAIKKAPVHGYGGAFLVAYSIAMIALEEES